MKKLIILLLLYMFPLVAWGADKPNIIFILSDDVGIGDIKCYYEPSQVKTTNIDMLAAQGMRFTQAYALGSVCSPTRYAWVVSPSRLANELGYQFKYSCRETLQRIINGSKLGETRST